MAFVARNDQHGNEIMRVMLSTEPGKLTVASCHNLRINCGPGEGEGRYDHRQRFHYFAEDSQMPQRRWEQKSQSLVDPVAQQEREVGQKILRKKQSHSDDESAAWNNIEINAHSTLVSPRKTADTIDPMSENNSKPFQSWLALKNKNRKQLAEHRRLVAEQNDQRASERAHLAQHKYSSWLNTKSTLLRRAKSDMSSVPGSVASRQSLSLEEAQKRMLQWEQEKLAALKAQRQKLKAKEEQQLINDTTRRELNAEAWEQWVGASKKKPRPVPIGKGLDSLRGSMAPLYTNPKEWQSISQSVKSNPQPQPLEQLSSTRFGRSFDRIDRLAKPKRKQSKTNQRVEQVAGKSYENCKIKEEDQVKTLIEKQLDRKEVQPAAFVVVEKDPQECGRNQSISTGSAEVNERVDDQDNRNEVDFMLPLKPRAKPIVWRKNNAQRVRELRNTLSPLEPEIPSELRDDQVEQLRKHQDLQNSKILPRKYQQKRDHLREKLKTWVEEGKLMPDQSLNDRILKLRPRENRKDLTKELMPQREVKANADNNDSKAQLSEVQMPTTTRNAAAAEMHPRSPDPVRLLKIKEQKGKSRPWR